MTSWSPTRRGLVAAAAAAAVPLAMCAGEAKAQVKGDVAVVAGLLDVEQVAVLAYDTIAASELMDGATRRLVERLRGHEQEHVDRLAGALERMSGRAPAKPTGAADVDRVAPGLGDARTEDDLLRFAIALESACVAAYHDALQQLTTAELLQTAGSIMAAQGQHLVVLRETLGSEPVVNVLETGGR